VIVWSNTIKEHTSHLRVILKALRMAGLYFNAKKCHFYLLEIDFLGHHISQRGVEVNSSKVDGVLQWPVPKNTTDVWSFLGLVRYIAVYLPKLADYTCMLTPLTTKECRKEFPQWTNEHQRTFEAIKALVVSRECLTTIDHGNLGNKKIFVTCDAIDWRTGAMLSVGETWENARPVAFDSMQLKGAELNYPVHKKELLAIMRALRKWRSDLLGGPIHVYTDHRTLENFNSQWELSRRQLRWQEYLSQYEMTVTYICGEDNTVTNALLRVPPNAYPDEKDQPMHEKWQGKVGAVLSLQTDSSIIQLIKEGYETDSFCQKLENGGSTIPGIKKVNELWYVGDRLVIPCTKDIRENLFRLAHDSAGHFGTDKSSGLLRDAYYWPNMCRDLEEVYIPSCKVSQRNKSHTTKVAGPLHPLPVPDQRGDSVAIDFIGPLPEDEGYDCILTMSDRLGGADIRIIPTRVNITAEEFAMLFFMHWYCENRLPLHVVSDWDKLFLSSFWQALRVLTGVRLKMPSSYHPETDGASKRTNKTVNQAIRFHVR
jgi:hypothetical protein